MGCGSFDERDQSRRIRRHHRCARLPVVRTGEVRRRDERRILGVRRIRHLRERAQPYLRPALERALREFDTYALEADSAEELVENLALRVEAIAKEEVPVDTGNLRASIEAERIQ